MSYVRNSRPLQPGFRLRLTEMFEISGQIRSFKVFLGSPFLFLILLFFGKLFIFIIIIYIYYKLLKCFLAQKVMFIHP